MVGPSNDIYTNKYCIHSVYLKKEERLLVKASNTFLSFLKEFLLDISHAYIELTKMVRHYKNTLLSNLKDILMKLL